MFCPKCNQQQLSEDVRFCSRCGFSLSAVAKLLSNDGILPANQLKTKENTSLLKRKGARIGGKIIFLSVFLTVPALALSIAFDSPFPFLIALIPFLIGLAQILYVFIFEESIIPLKRDEQVPELSAKEDQFYLPPSQGIPISIIDSKPLNTTEIIEPPSVTEHTTRLLKKEAPE